MDFKTLLSGLVGSASQAVQTQNPVADHYVRYVGALLSRAVGSWSAVHEAGVKCGIELRGRRGERARCGGPAIAACMVCGGAVCVDHALISPEHIMCLGCAFAAQQSLSGAPRGPDGSPYQAERPPWQSPESSPFGFVDGAEAQQDRQRRQEAFDVLGLTEDATEEEIKEAYRQLARRWHPDRAPERRKEEYERKLRRLNEARDTLLGRRAA